MVTLYFLPMQMLLDDGESQGVFSSFAKNIIRFSIYIIVFPLLLWVGWWTFVFFAIVIYSFSVYLMTQIFGALVTGAINIVFDFVFAFFSIAISMYWLNYGINAIANSIGLQNPSETISYQEVENKGSGTIVSNNR
jgi:hypothetical protein